MICPHCGHDNVPGNDVCASCLHDLAQLDQPVPRDRVQSDLMDDRSATSSRGRRSPCPVPPPLADAVRMMLDEGVGTVLVVDDGGALPASSASATCSSRVPD